MIQTVIELPICQNKLWQPYSYVFNLRDISLIYIELMFWSILHKKKWSILHKHSSLVRVYRS